MKTEDSDDDSLERRAHQAAHWKAAKTWYPRDVVGVIQLVFTIGAIVWAAAKLAAGQDAVISTLQSQQQTTRDLTLQVERLNETMVRLEQQVADDRRDLDGLRARKP